jgi:hypothetical protein
VVKTPRFFSHIIPVVKIGACPAAAAYFLVLTGSAASLVFLCTETLKYLCLTPDFSKGGFPNISGCYIKIGAGLYNTPGWFWSK